MKRRMRPRRALFRGKINKLAERIAKNLPELDKLHYEMPGAIELIDSFSQQIAHDEAQLKKAIQKRKTGWRGAVRALASWKAYRNLRELKKIRSADELQHITSEYAIRRSHKLSTKYWTGVASPFEAREYFRLKKRRLFYNDAMRRYETLQNLKRKRKERKAAKHAAISRRTSERK